jgi:hypothetical protein
MADRVPLPKHRKDAKDVGISWTKVQFLGIADLIQVDAAVGLIRQ